MSYGSADFEKAKRAYHPYSSDNPPTRSASQPATLHDDGRDPLGFFRPTPEATAVSAEPPQPQPPVPLVPQLTPSFNPPDALELGVNAQQMAMLCAVPNADADDISWSMLSS